MATIIIEPEHLSRMMVSLHPAAPTGSCHESELARSRRGAGAGAHRLATRRMIQPPHPEGHSEILSQKQ
jgi:hypothetical protein